MIEVRAGQPRDPTADSAWLLQRIGFFTLGIALPVSAMLSRRAAVVLVPIGVALLVIAAVLIEPERFQRSLRRRSVKATALALAVLLGWTWLSSVWGAPGAAVGDRVANMALALGLGIAGIAALPEKPRTANLYAIAVGVGAAALLALLALATGVNLTSAPEDDILFERGLSLLAILAWPVAGWLLLRGRAKAVGLLGLVLGVAAILSESPTLIASLLTGLATFALVTAMGARATRLAAWIGVGVVMLAPLAAFGLPRPLALVGMAETSASLGAWAAVIAQEPAKLITGHGFATIAARQAAGHLSQAFPVSIVAEIWHELGLVGAVAFAAVLWHAIRAVLVLPAMLQAGAVAAYAVALMLGLLGLAGFRAWWLMTIAGGVVLTTALARGQAQTRRPIAAFVRSRAAPQEPAAPPAAGKASDNQAAAG